ncbi:MAG: hypothetical protein GY765_10350, partial [bacterium]|nr:hypothetical protein [bacterium]
MTIQRQRIYVLIFITCAIGLGVIVYLNSLANTYDKEHKKIALGLFNPDLQKLTDLRPEVFKTDKFIQMDLRDKFDILKTCAFHSLTKWPPKEKLPGNFDPLEFIDMGKDPGLGIRDLHRKGITGKGVNVAIIDYSLLRAHEEFREKVALYRNTDGKEAEPGSKSMHGTAVASLLVGDTCGVAPGATLHYWGEARAAAGYVHKIEGIKQILAFNENKELKDRIRVLSISVGADPKVNHYKEFKNILAVAREKGLLVVIVYDWLHGVGCSLYKDRNEPGNYQMWLRTQGLENRMPPGE